MKDVIDNLSCELVMGKKLVMFSMTMRTGGKKEVPVDLSQKIILDHSNS